MQHANQADRTRAVIERFLDAFEAQDFDAAAACLSPQSFEYQGPMDHFHDAGAFIDDLIKIGQILRRIERRRLLVEGHEACAILTFVTTLPDIERNRVAEWITVRDDLIVRMEGFLDVRAYARMLGI